MRRYELSWSDEFASSSSFCQIVLKKKSKQSRDIVFYVFIPCQHPRTCMFDSMLCIPSCVLQYQLALLSNHYICHIALAILPIRLSESYLLDRCDHKPAYSSDSLQQNPRKYGKMNVRTATLLQDPALACCKPDKGKICELGRNT